ncbi:MAG TPA: serine protease [Solirubrobacterales bacterium]|nr:serine protease [Solirubrobacterales bacterium]
MKRESSFKLRGVWAAGALLLVSLVLAVPAGASRGGAAASIVGGTTASGEEWPWAAFILAADSKGEGFSCTGTVVSPNLILTAGHCAEDIVSGRKTPRSQYVVVTGSSDVRDAAMRQVSKVSRVIVYPHFNRFKVHGDAALLMLATPTTAPPIALATPTDAALLSADTPTWIAGWGLSGPLRKLKRTPVLRRAATYVQRRLYCRNHARAYYPFFNYSSQLCTITPPGFSIGTCHGDSGGPALAFREDGTPVQIGITSLGAANCDTSLPDIFTRVDRVYPWIAEQIAATATG